MSRLTIRTVLTGQYHFCLLFVFCPDGNGMYGQPRGEGPDFVIQNACFPSRYHLTTQLKVSFVY